MKNYLIRLMAFAFLAVLLLLGLNPGNFNSAQKHLPKRIKFNNEYQTGADRQLQMWLWSKGYPDPTHLGRKYQNAWQEMLDVKQNTLALFGSARTNNYGSWTSLGSVAGIGGRVVCIAIDPTNTQRLFIGTASGGIYKTTNGGSNWTYVPTGLPVLGVSAILIHPTNPDTIYAGTGEVYRVDTSNIGFNVWKARGTYGIGIIRSFDGGTSWEQVYDKDMSELFGIQMLKFDPNNPSTVYACATDGLYRSTDNGDNWTNIRPKTYVSDVAINPANSNQIAIGFGNMVNPGKGIEYSVNGGSNWSAISSLPSFAGYIRFDHSGSNLFASVGNGSGSELYLSTDWGQTWYQKTNSGHCGGQYWFAHDLAVSPTNPNYVIMGGVSYYTYTSSNSTTGGTRSSFSIGVHADVHDIKFDPTNSNVIYIANDGGMYKSTDGSTFSAINNGLVAVQFYASFAVSPTNANVMIGGLQDNGVVKYDGTNWTSILGGDGGPSVFHPLNGNKVLYSNDARAVFYSTNAGTTETQRMLNLGYGYASPYDHRTGFMSPVAMSVPNGAGTPVVYYAASDNLHISIDSGTSFQRTDPTLASGANSMTRPIDAYNKPAIALAVSRSNRNKVYVSTSPVSQLANDALSFIPPARIMRSLNASNSTSYTFADINVSATVPDRFVTDFAISRFSDDSVWITLGGFGTTHVYLTPDGGTTWLPRGSGLPDVPFNAIVVDPYNASILYAGCDLGVYVSPDKGLNWYDFNNGLWESTLVMDLQITANNQIVAATHGKGVFRSGLFNLLLLPVNFTSFTGINKNNFNELQWTTAQESSLSRYELERSDDGASFTRVATVSARNSATPTSYSYNDNITGRNSPTYYYRIRAVNNDGSYVFSDIVFIRISKDGKFRVLGNPFTHELRLQFSASTASTASFKLFDLNGRELRRREITAQQGLNTITIDGLSSLPAGTYICELWINRNRVVQKVMKNNYK